MTMDVETSGLLLTAGRLLMGGVFVIAGIRHYFIAPAVVQAIQARGVPFPRLVLFAGSMFEALCGLLLILGLLVAPASLGLAVFTVTASVMLLDFWNLDGDARVGAQNGWLSNVAVVGGLLMTASQAL